MAALRAGYLAFLLSVLGTVAIAAAVLSGPPAPATIAGTIGAPVTPDLEARRALAVAARTEACMATRGLPIVANPAPPQPIPDAHLDPVAWADRWGFGIATSVGVDSPELTDDPTMTRLSALSPILRQRYIEALYGNGTGRPGCHEQATDEVYGLRDRELAPLHSRLMDLDRAIAADPAGDTLEQAWDACIRALGIRATERSTLVDRMRRSFSERTGAVGADARLLRAVADEERRIAGGIARCELAYAEGRTRIAAPHEARFVAAYRSLLIRIGDRIRAAEAAYPISQPAKGGFRRSDAAR